MNQGRAEHKLAGINSAHSVFDVEVPVRLNWYAVKYSHEGPNGKPDYGACAEYIDSWSDVGDTEQAPIEA